MNNVRAWHVWLRYGHTTIQAKHNNKKTKILKMSAKEL